MGNDVETFSGAYFVIDISSSVKCLFMFSTYFLTGILIFHCSVLKFPYIFKICVLCQIFALQIFSNKLYLSFYPLHRVFCRPDIFNFDEVQLTNCSF